MDSKKNRIIGVLSIILLIDMFLISKGIISSWSILIGLVPLLFWIFTESKKMNEDTLKCLVIIIMFQNLFLVLFAKVLNSNTTNIYIIVKEAMVVACVLYAFIRYKRTINLFDILAVLFITMVSMSFIITNTAIMAKLSNYRQLTLPIVLIYFGNCLNISEDKYESVFEFIINLGKILFIFGIIQVVLGQKVFDYIPVKEFYENKGFAKWLYNGIYPLSFIAWDLHQIFGVVVVRFTSFIYEALSAGHLMALCFIIMHFYNPLKYNIKKYYIWSGCFLLGAILSFSKGAFLILGVYLIFYIKNKIKNKKSFYSLCAVLMVGLITAVYLVWDKVYSIKIHVVGLVYNLINANFLKGEGIGKIGVYASTFNESIEAKGESLVGNMAGQLGTFSVLLFISIFLLIIYLLFKSNKKYNIIPIILIIGVALEMFLSESSVAFLSTGLYFILAGMYCDFNQFKLYLISNGKATYYKRFND